jgi:hypothetical protein
MMIDPLQDKFKEKPRKSEPDIPCIVTERFRKTKSPQDADLHTDIKMAFGWLRNGKAALSHVQKLFQDSLAQSAKE